MNGTVTFSIEAPWWAVNTETNRWELVSTYTREVAGFTCEQCPQTFQMYVEPVTHYSKYGQWSEWRRVYPVRCTECSRLMKRWQRGRAAGERLLQASEMYGQGLSFVTLTLPNYWSNDPAEATRDLKHRVAAFRGRFPMDAVSGGYDFYEWTLHPDDACWTNPIYWNVHHHGIWVMDFWNQREMENAWGEGIVHLFRVEREDAEYRTVKYATKYAGKQDVKGIRLRQAFGCLYGSARRAVELAYAVRHGEVSSIAAGAPV